MKVIMCDNCKHFHPMAGCTHPHWRDCLHSELWAPKEAEKPDNVNHPGHYETGKFECIEVMEEALGAEAVLAFCVCNAFKYLYRHKRKNGIEDIKKARWYLDKFIELAERGVSDDQSTTASV